MADIAPVTLLLGVNGVLNIARRSTWPGDDMRATVSADGADRPVSWSPQLVDRLDELHQSGLVEIVWCSTWCPHADALNALLGVRYRAAAWSAPLSPAHATLLKQAHADFVLGEGKRLIWCDAEAIPRARDRRWLGMTGDALFISPHPSTGLTPKHLEQIVAFASRPYALC